MLRSVTALAVAVAVAGAAAAPRPAAARRAAEAATVTIGGFAFHDLDADGHRDPDERGLPGLRVHHSSGTPVTTTDDDGHYQLAGLPTTGRIQLQSGWLRSQCYDPVIQDCPAGPGDDNDFPTRNQFFEYPLAGASSADDINVGLLPDWPGPGMAPPPPLDGVTPANEVDVAARLSGGPDTCGTDAFGICAAGDTFEQFGQVHNQGIRPVTGLRVKVLIPPGDCLAGIAVVTAATSPAVGEMRTRPAAGSFGCDTRVVEVAFAGTLVPAGAIRLSITGTVQSGPGTPGCTLDATPAATCATGAPQGRTLMLGVSHIDQRGDPDSGFCARRDLGRCATGLHDKRREPDEVDPAGHNVDAALGGTAGFNLRMSYARVDPRGRVAALVATPGEEITVRGWVRNQIGTAEPTNQAHAGATVRFLFPPGTTVVGLPAAHPLHVCALADPAGPTSAGGTAGTGDTVGAAGTGGTGAASGTAVSCRYTSPLAPHVGSIALNVVVRVPADWQPGRPFRSIACVTPAAGQTGETNPPAERPCGLDTLPAVTATDNDADLFQAVVPRPGQ